MLCQKALSSRDRVYRSAFTLVEILVVILIVGLVFVSAAVVFTRGSVANREAARLIHGAPVGARDAAIGKGAPRGIRLVPDPAFPLPRLANGQIDPAVPLCCNRIVPIDKLRFGESGSWYTVVGPMTTYNAELFVNCGTPGVDFPGVKSPLKRFYNGFVEVEFLFLVNGRDDNGNGLVDEGFDGIDNNLDGVIDDLAEWEPEVWWGAQASVSTFSAPYTIARRPFPSPGTGIVELPSSVVIDLSSWATTRERSRLPVNVLSGEVDIMITPRGDVVPTTIYSTPASFGMQDSLLHFWIGDRGDVFDPRVGSFPQLPLPQGLVMAPDGRELKGDITILSINTRTGFIASGAPSTFDTAHIGTPSYNAGLPFLASSRGGR